MLHLLFKKRTFPKVARISAASSIETVLNVLYANVSAVDRAICLAFLFRLARLASPSHRSLGIFSECGPTCTSVLCSTVQKSGPPAARINSRMSSCGWLCMSTCSGTAGGSRSWEGECGGDVDPGSWASSSSESPKAVNMQNKHYMS